MKLSSEKLLEVDKNVSIYTRSFQFLKTEMFKVHKHLTIAIRRNLPQLRSVNSVSYGNSWSSCVFRVERLEYYFYKIYVRKENSKNLWSKGNPKDHSYWFHKLYVQNHGFIYLWVVQARNYRGGGGEGEVSSALFWKLEKSALSFGKNALIVVSMS